MPKLPQRVETDLAHLLAGICPISFLACVRWSKDSAQHVSVRQCVERTPARQETNTSNSADTAIRTVTKEERKELIGTVPMCLVIVLRFRSLGRRWKSSTRFLASLLEQGFDIRCDILDRWVLERLGECSGAWGVAMFYAAVRLLYVLSYHRSRQNARTVVDCLSGSGLSDNPKSARMQ